MDQAKQIGYFSAFILPILLVAGYLLGGYFNFLVAGFVFIFIPLLDFWIGTDESNPKVEVIPENTGKLYYRMILYIWVYVQLTLLVFGFYAVTSGLITETIEWIGFVLGTGLITGGVGITVAHELGHKKSKLQRIYSRILLMTVSYMHFYIEHNKGHHVRVATPEDPATARKGESFYHFWLRSVIGGYKSAWNIELERLRRINNPILSFRNQMIWYTILPLVFCGAVMGLFFILQSTWFWEIPAFYFGQSVIAFTLLELVNYVEHYGILRTELSPGHYERVNETHSWNASHLISNFFLFQLQRHSDHHVNAIKPYQVLKHYDSSPQLPASYPTMIILALFPPLWFRIVDRILEGWNERSKIYVASY